MENKATTNSYEQLVDLIHVTSPSRYKQILDLINQEAQDAVEDGICTDPKEAVEIILKGIAHDLT